ncbi:MAG TPA: hypothetical protein VGX23_27865 [Actinocrinis sp.]|nr:hypothetical protein [Actinocrinis sp.]
MPADSTRARELAERVAAGTAELVTAMTGKYDLDDARRRIVEFNPSGETARRLADTTGLKLLTSVTFSWRRSTTRPDRAPARTRPWRPASGWPPPCAAHACSGPIRSLQSAVDVTIGEIQFRLDREAETACLYYIALR